MKRKIKLISIILILILLISINISYAINLDELSFFEASKTEISKGELLELTIDLSKIDYNQFEILLSSNIEVEDIYTEEVDDDIILNEENNNIVVNIDKESLKLDKIILYYQIAEDIEIGAKIKFAIQIINFEETEVLDKKQIEITVIEETDDNKDKETGNEEETKGEESGSKDETKGEEPGNKDETKSEETGNQGTNKDEGKSEKTLETRGKRRNL